MTRGGGANKAIYYICIYFFFYNDGITITGASRPTEGGGSGEKTVKERK